MAGKNIILGKGKTLFKQGEQPNGMYLLRRGKLQVYLDEGGTHVPLATIEQGGMIGEMSLFDNLARSASVKTLEECEVTLINNDDFKNLMKQIPRWFMVLMKTLSNRLRVTNDRLERTEKKLVSISEPIFTVIKILQVIELLWHRDGTKEGKEWVMPKENSIKFISSMFSEDSNLIDKIFNSLIDGELISESKNSYGHPIYCLASRGSLRKFNDFISKFVEFTDHVRLERPAFDLLKVLLVYAEKNPYKSFTVSLIDLYPLAKGPEIKLSPQWKDHLPLLSRIHSQEISMIAKEDGGISITSSKKDLTNLVQLHNIFKALHSTLKD